ncbi:hypothetical protein [Capnocytophaga gingivalis]
MKKIMACLVIMAALVGCSKSDSGEERTIVSNNYPKKITMIEEDGKILHTTEYTILDGKILSYTSQQYENGTPNIKKSINTISYDGNYIKEVKQQGGWDADKIETFSYKDGKLEKKVVKYTPNEYIDTPYETYTISYEYNGENLSTIKGEPIVTISRNINDPREKEKMHIDEYRDIAYTHSGEQIVENILIYKLDEQGNKKDIRFETNKYTFSGNDLIKKEVTTRNQNITYEYTYDTSKKNINRNNVSTLEPNYFINGERSEHALKTKKRVYNGTTTEYEYVYEYKNDQLVKEERFKKKDSGNVLELTTEYEY